MIESVHLPYPTRRLVGPLANERSLCVGDKVLLAHTVRENEYCDAIVVGLTTPNRSVEVRPTIEINSPANWEIVALMSYPTIGAVLVDPALAPGELVAVDEKTGRILGRLVNLATP